MAVFGDTETTKQCGGIALGIPSLELGKTLLEFGGTHAVGIAEIGLCVQGVLFLHYIPQHGMAAKDGLEDGAVVEFEVILFQHAHTLAGALGDSTGRWRELTGKHAHESRLAGSVGTYYTIAVAGCEFEVDILKERFFTELDAKICNCNHL